MTIVLSDPVAHVRGTGDNPVDRAEVIRKSGDLTDPFRARQRATASSTGS